MLTIEKLRNFDIGFEFGDMFRKGRIKELIFGMKERIAYDEGEIEKWRLTAQHQAEVINKLYNRLENQSYEAELRAQNAELTKQLNQTLESMKALQEYAESLEKKLDDVHVSDTEAYRILSAMRSAKNREDNTWLNEEVS